MKNWTKIIILVIALVIIALLIWKGGSSPTASSSKPVATVEYSCDAGKAILATFYQGPTKPATSAGGPPTPGGSVALTLSDGRTMTLNQTVSADGGRYANADESFVFWGKGNGALVLEGGVSKDYTGCIALAPVPSGSDLAQAYSNSTYEFSILLPKGYTPDASYTYQELGPGKDISGVKFTIATSTAAGTNLSPDTYISVEEIPKVQECSASLFLSPQGGTSAAETMTDDTGTTYSVASSTGAGAGNRYEETVYALPGTNPCVAVRYFIHYGVIDNYPPGAVQQFDEQALLTQFDAIRRSLVIVQ